MTGHLHVSPVLPPDLEERARDLTERRHADGLEQLLEHIAAVSRHPLKPLERVSGLEVVAAMEESDSVELLLLLHFGPSHQLYLRRGLRALRRKERVHADDGQLSRVLAVLVEHRLLLDLAALVHALHRAEHTAAVRDPLELQQHGLFHQVR